MTPPAATRTINLDDTPPPKSPPRTAPTPPTTGATGTTDTGPSTAPPRTRDMAKLEAQLRDFYTQFGTYAGMMMPDPFAGALVAGNAEMLASAWTDLAAQDINVRRTLERILSGGSWAAVIGGHAVGVILPILAYYGKLPAQATQMILGVTAAAASMPPDEGGNPVVAQRIMARFGAPTE